MKRSSLVFLVLTAFALLACQKVVDEPVPKGEDDAISFIVNEARPYVTKSSSDHSLSLYSEEIFSTDSLTVNLTVNEGDYHSDFFIPAQTETKGAPYIDDNIGKFYVSALFSNMQPFFTGLELNSDGSTVSTGYYWPLSTPATKLNFFGHAKNGADGTISSHNYISPTSASFRYSLPVVGVEKTDAVNQPDMLFAISPDQEQTGSPVQMDFYHALSALAFSVGSVPGNLKIEKVEITNIYSSGTCTYTHQSGGLSFDWSFGVGDEKKGYTQTFAKELFSDGNIPFPNGTAINTDQQTFMMIPQEIGNDTKIIFTVSFNGRLYSIERSLKLMTNTWLPGKLYTFRISSPEEVEVEVNDDVVMDGIYPVKQNLQIRNTGLADSYLRVVIDGSWVVDDDTNGGEPVSIIVADWKPDDEGIYTWPGGAAGYDQTKWFKSDDGYYYYLHVTHPGETIPPLFDSYKLTAQAPMAGAYLEMDVLVQSVYYGHVQDFFPDEVLSKMGLLP